MNAVLKILGGIAALLAIFACVVVPVHFYTFVNHARWSIGSKLSWSWD